MEMVISSVTLPVGHVRDCLYRCTRLICKNVPCPLFLTPENLETSEVSAVREKNVKVSRDMGSSRHKERSRWVWANRTVSCKRS